MSVVALAIRHRLGGPHTASVAAEHSAHTHRKSVALSDYQ